MPPTAPISRANTKPVFRAWAAVPALAFITALTFLPSSGWSAEGGSVGQPTPVFKQADLAGAEQDLQADLDAQRVVLLDYWSIYCVSCVQEIPSLVAIYDKLKDKGLAAYGIDLDSFSPKRVQKFIDGLTFKITYPIIVDQKRDIANSFKVSMLPTTIVIGRDGKIKMFHVGYKPGDEKDIEDLITKELAVPVKKK